MAAATGAMSTRVRLIEAGIELLSGLTPSEVVATVGTRKIARQAGVSPSAFFHHFESLERYTDELMDEIYSPTRLPRGENVRKDLESVAVDDLPVSALLATYRNALRLNLGDPEYRLKLGLWSLGGPGADRHYRDYQNAVDEMIAIGAGQMLESWSREPRPPFDLAGIIAVGNALSQGAYIRHSHSPELLTIDRFAYAITGTVLVGVRLTGDNRTMADRLAEMNYYPRVPRPDRHVSDSDANTKERFVDAAAELFAEYGVEATSVDQLVRRVGVSSSTFFNLYGSKGRLAVALFDRYAELQLDTRKGKFDPEDPVRDFLMSVSELVGRYIDLSRVYLAEIAADDTGTTGACLVDPLADLLVSLIGDPVDSDDGEHRDLAEAMITVVVMRIVRRPGLGIDSAARWALRMLGDTGSR
jgi:AcrR family transcriptional regulator